MNNKQQMTHDFAKIRPEPVLEQKPAASPPAWSLLFTGVLVGITVGVLGCILFYLSGNVPPLNPTATMAANNVTAETAVAEDTAVEQPDEELQFEFYTELRDYEVGVDATPVELAEHERPEAALPNPLMLQTGAFQQRESANTEMTRLQGLGLEAIVKSQDVPGRTLFLVQAGPYNTQGELAAAQRTLRANSISSMPVSLQ